MTEEKPSYSGEFTGHNGMMTKARLGMQSSAMQVFLVQGAVRWTGKQVPDSGPRLAEDLPRARSHCINGDCQEGLGFGSIQSDKKRGS
jgi:hypothetical protein